MMSARTTTLVLCCMDFWLAIKLLLLLITANGAPVLARYLLGSRWGRPVDAGATFSDGQPLFGPSKTWRGVIAALLVTPVIAWLLFLPPGVGLLFAAAAMLGDLLSSFIKRRLRIPSSSMALGLDQIPESLLPLLAVRAQFYLEPLDIVQLTLAFMALELALSQLLYHLRIRKQPY
ncbi:MAG TPA: CDP-archaeol synthase [Gammaproteobacteria bacterium]